MPCWAGLATGYLLAATSLRRTGEAVFENYPHYVVIVIFLKSPLSFPFASLHIHKASQKLKNRICTSHIMPPNFCN